MARHRGQLGSVRIRSGAWYGQYVVYVIQDGKEVRRGREVFLGQKSISKRDARAKLIEIIQRDTSTKLPAPDSTVPFRWFWEQRFLPMKTKWSDNQRKTIIGIFNLHVLPTIGDANLDEIDRFRLQILLNSIAEKKSESVVDKVFTYLKACFDEAVDLDFLEKSPARKLEMPTVKPVCKRNLSKDEIERIMGAVTGRDRLIIHCLISLALRPGELFALRWKDLRPGQVIIDEQTYRNRMRAPKTERSSAQIVLPASLESELLFWKQTRPRTGPDDFVFESRYHGIPQDPRRWQRDVLRPLGRRLGIEGLTFQSFRRTFATQAIEMGANVKQVQGQMRHASADMTVNEYAQVVDDSLRRVVEDYDRRFCPKYGKNEQIN